MLRTLRPRNAQEVTLQRYWASTSLARSIQIYIQVPAMARTRSSYISSHYRRVVSLFIQKILQHCVSPYQQAYPRLQPDVHGGHRLTHTLLRRSIMISIRVPEQKALRGFQSSYSSLTVYTGTRKCISEKTYIGSPVQPDCMRRRYCIAMMKHVHCDASNCTAIMPFISNFWDYFLTRYSIPMMFVKASSLKLGGRYTTKGPSVRHLAGFFMAYITQVRCALVCEHPENSSDRANVCWV
ncbi:hypothetical protein C8Q79DRAFT_285749 [Trametes meyenii]|nr:hypothetical protein C8Q79DRAFT_285749 [Trametes meyenii]